MPPSSDISQIITVKYSKRHHQHKEVQFSDPEVRLSRLAYWLQPSETPVNQSSYTQESVLDWFPFAECLMWPPEELRALTAHFLSSKLSALGWMWRKNDSGDTNQKLRWRSSHVQRWFLKVKVGSASQNLIFALCTGLRLTVKCHKVI